MTKTQRNRILAMHRDGVTEEICIHAISSIVWKEVSKYADDALNSLSLSERKEYFIKLGAQFHSKLAKEISMFLQKTSDGRSCRKNLSPDHEGE